MTVRRLPALACLAIMLPLVAAGQETDNRAADLFAGNDSTQVAPVEIDGVMLFRVRGISAFPADLRAELVRQRIITVARDASIPADSGRVEESPGRFTIFFGDLQIVSLVAADAELEEIEPALLAEIVLSRIAIAIEEYRESRSADQLLRATLILAAITLAAALLIFLTMKAFGWINRIVSVQAERTQQHLDKTSRRLIDLQQIAAWSQAPLKALLLLLFVTIFLSWLNTALGLYPWTRPFASRVLDLVLSPLEALGTGLLRQMPNLVFLFILGFVTRFVLAGARHFFDRIHRGRIPLANFDREWALPTYRIVRLLVLAFALIVAYPYIPGSSSEAFKGVSIFLGVIFSIGSSSFIGSIIAGYSLIYRRAFGKGDLVQIGALKGFVVETRALSTQIRSIKNELINIPNSTVLNSEIINYSSLEEKDGLILHTAVSIGYDVPWRQVESLLLAAASRTSGLKDEPAPFVLRKELGDFAVVYELNVYCGSSQGLERLYSDLHSNVLDAFNEAGIQIMSPHYESDPATPKLAERESQSSR